MHQTLRRLADEFLFLFALSAFAGGYINIPSRLASQIIEPGASNPYNTLSMAGILFSLIVFAGADWRRFIEVARHAMLVNAFLVLAGLSIFWSLDPAVTLRRDITLLTTVGFSYYALTRFTVSDIIRRIAAVMVLAAIFSALLAVAMPRLGVMSEGTLAGDWNGVFTHKQELGWAMFLGILSLGWLLLHDRGWRRLLYCGGIGLCFGCLVMARSQTAMLSTLAMPLVAAGTQVARLPTIGRMWASLAMLTFLLLAGSLFALNLDAGMALLDRDVSLTGRVPLWQLLLEIAGERPLTGFGYGAFWLQVNWVAHYIWDVIGWPAPEAHNSYLDIQLQLGLPGLLIATLVLLGCLRQVLAAVHDRVEWGTFAAVYIITLSITNMVETMLFHQGDLQCMLVPMLYAALRLRNSPVVPQVRGGARLQPGFIPPAPLPVR